jgi:hypothetical protein
MGKKYGEILDVGSEVRIDSFTSNLLDVARDYLLQPEDILKKFQCRLRIREDYLQSAVC